MMKIKLINELQETIARRKVTFFVFLLLSALFVAPFRAGFAGTLKGKLVSSEEFTAYLEEDVEKDFSDKEDYYWMIENGVLPIKTPSVDWSTELTIALMQITGPGAPPKMQNVMISGAVFNPAVIVVPPKTTIKFKNEDPFVHSIFSPELGQTFSPEILPSRQLRQVQFMNPGVYAIKCKMTPHLEGYVIVDPKVLYTTSPAKDATFLFEDITPGKYLLKVFYKNGVVASQEVEIVDDKKDVEVEVKISAPKAVVEEKKPKEKKKIKKKDDKKDKEKSDEKSEEASDEGKDIKKKKKKGKK